MSSRVTAVRRTAGVLAVVSGLGLVGSMLTRHAQGMVLSLGGFGAAMTVGGVVVLRNPEQLLGERVTYSNGIQTNVDSEGQARKVGGLALVVGLGLLGMAAAFGLMAANRA